MGMFTYFVIILINDLLDKKGERQMIPYEIKELCIKSSQKHSDSVTH